MDITYHEFEAPGVVHFHSLCMLVLLLLHGVQLLQIGPGCNSYTSRRSSAQWTCGGGASAKAGWEIVGVTHVCTGMNKPSSEWNCL